MAHFIILLGPPGAGKGTQAERIIKKLGIVHISSGNLFRENLEKETDLGRLAKSYMDKGELVPDNVTIAMVRERLTKLDCQTGALLDGFPRTPAQAKALDKILAEKNESILCVPYIKVPEDLSVERLSGRWTCREAGHVYHEKYNPPKEKGICDIDGSPLYQRDDDKRRTVEQRIKVYSQQTAPLIDYYDKNGLLRTIDGTKEIDEITESILKEIT
ncbi:MAG TPA: adenylate kinase [Anaerolineae bacterium]|nr:adenylate kinase [Anaerolineae bacterium]